MSLTGEVQSRVSNEHRIPYLLVGYDYPLCHVSHYYLSSWLVASLGPSKSVVWAQLPSLDLHSRLVIDRVDNWEISCPPFPCQTNSSTRTAGILLDHLTSLNCGSFTLGVVGAFKVMSNSCCEACYISVASPLGPCGRIWIDGWNFKSWTFRLTGMPKGQFFHPLLFSLWDWGITYYRFTTQL